MYEAGWGRVINIASVHGLVASPYKSAYVAAKHGLVGLTKTVALEAAARCPDVTAHAVCPLRAHAARRRRSRTRLERTVFRPSRS